jgi:hypothetical protein
MSKSVLEKLFGGAFVCALWLLPPVDAFAKKTNQAVYQEPFDVAAGGASLTRASQEAVLFANPALMPYGGKFLRWFGTQFTALYGKDSASMVQGLATNKKSSSEEDGGSETSSVSDTFTTPIHFAVQNATTFISNNLGVGVFARFEPDIKGQKHNSTGVPELRARAEGYAGGALSFAARPLNWFSVGLTAKYLYASEPDISVALTETSKVAELQNDPQALRDEASYGNGLGFDLGTLFFSQGKTFDWRLALKVDDIGGTQFTGSQDAFMQTVAAGIGFTIHGTADSIHFGLDYRDILGAYEEQAMMKTYAGVKVILRSFLALGAGYYQGYPSYGIRLNLFVLKVGYTSYTREMGEYPGDDPRPINMGYVAIGF